MSVKIHLHRIHRPDAGGLETVEVEGRTVGDCLTALVGRFPALKAKLFTAPGKLHRNVEIYLNQESAYPDELKKPVSDGDEIHVTLILTGG